MNYEVILLALLAFFISSAIAGYLDGGLYSSIYCAQNGETEECFRRLSESN